MLRIMTVLLILQTPLQGFNRDVLVSSRCTEVGYTQLYEDVTRMMIDGYITGKDRYYLVMAMRHEMCGKEMYAKYEAGIEALDER